MADASNATGLKGSCLCRQVEYEIRGPIGPLSHCHCSMCRKAHGAAFGTYGRVRWQDFRFTRGEEAVRKYASSPRIDRTFCGHCGSTLQFVREGKPYFGLAVGTLDDDPGARPELEIWVRDRAPWWELHGDLPAHAGYPEP